MQLLNKSDLIRQYICYLDSFYIFFEFFIEHLKLNALIINIGKTIVNCNLQLVLFQYLFLTQTLGQSWKVGNFLSITSLTGLVDCWYDRHTVDIWFYGFRLCKDFIFLKRKVLED